MGMTAALAVGLTLHAGDALAQRAGPANSAAAAGEIADFFGQLGDRIFKDCIFELSDEQIQVQQALVDAVVDAAPDLVLCTGDLTATATEVQSSMVGDSFRIQRFNAFI